MANCRFCGEELKHVFADLGLSPVSNAFVCEQDRNKPEVFYPLAAYVCDKCFLVQTLDFAPADHHFHDSYIYFSSFSTAWVAHAKAFVEKIIPARKLNKNSQVIELASNDGYLLRHFIPYEIPILGIEPSKNVAAEAEKKGVPSLVKFFGVDTAKELVKQEIQADVIVANNVLAHVPDINDFAAGINILLKPNGIASVEFPWLLNLIEKNQFDTIYHEHYSYLSLTFLTKLFLKNGLEIFDVEELPTHGGSLRVYIKKNTNTSDSVSPSCAMLLDSEERLGLSSIKGYGSFQEKIVRIKLDFLSFLVNAKRNGKKVVAYGAPAKGNTLLNYCGVGPELISFTVDISPHKQGMLLPGTRIQVRPVEAIYEEKPDYIVILPWNIKDEIMDQMKEVRNWGCRFVVPIPSTEENC
ncbi:MAG: class I SAM-dependent methyltransferase [Bdellovibrionales bacterium]|nr:class I SAM-dependent methyltransferase [Bdellovibrionales bacterium]